MSDGRPIVVEFDDEEAGALIGASLQSSVIERLSAGGEHPSDTAIQRAHRKLLIAYGREHADREEGRSP